MARWWLHEDGQTIGPFEEQDVRDDVVNGHVPADLPACRDGETTWQPVGRALGLDASPSPGGPALTEARLASPLRRIAAILLDVVVLYGGVAVLILAGAAAGVQDGDPATAALAVIGLVWMAFVVTWYVLGEARLGQTFGRHLMGIQLVRRHTGQPIGAAAVIGRAIVRQLGGYAFLLGWLWMLWDPDRQGWHDKVADSIVIDATIPHRPGGHIAAAFRGGW